MLKLGMLRFATTLTAFGLLALGGAGCASSGDAAASESNLASDPHALDTRFFDANGVDDDVFVHQNPDPAKVDIAALEKMLADAQATGSESAIVTMGDAIVAEKYFGHPGGLTSVQSVTKSVTSLLIGILIDRGRIPSLDTPMSTWFPAWANDPAKAQVTLRHMVTMTSGMSDQPAITTLVGGSYVETLGARPLAYAPGQYFIYSTYGAYLLTKVVRQASGMLVDDFARQALFGPLGITQFNWYKDPQGNADTGGGLYLRPRDMLRIGRLLRDKGEWRHGAESVRVVSEAWLAESAVPIAESACYGFEWWILRDGCDSNAAPHDPGPVQGFFADGFGGQYITVVPDRGVVGVRTITPPMTVTDVNEFTRTSFYPFVHEVAAVGR